MLLPPGSRLGPYEILAPLGAGGMGEVYRARDTRLERTVAIKVLPEHLSSPEGRQRFEREAKTISQLAHPHVCALYDVGNQDGTEYLVMEFLEGETLTDRLANGPLRVEQVLRYGIEMADALDKAHRQGIVHRDLKPGNVMITKSGVKLLDFGLAKAMAPATPHGSLTALPTQQGLTQEGTILGTFQYMAPEQLEGKDTDARTDIFALGAVLYEMATGRKAFTGGTQASLISSILRDDPQPISQVQPMTPSALDRAVKTCLARDPEDRWQSAADIQRELKWIAEGGSQAGVAAPSTARRGVMARFAGPIAGLLSGALLTGLVVRLWLSHEPAREAPKPAWLSMLLPSDAPLATYGAQTLAFSPDGTRLVYTAEHGGTTQLYLRSLDRLEAMPVKDSEGAVSAFFSPDSRWLGFFAGTRLMKLELTGPPVSVLDGVMILSPYSSPLFGLSGTGALAYAPGSPPRQNLVSVDRQGKVEPLPYEPRGYEEPRFSPDGKRLAVTFRADNPDIWILDISRGTSARLTFEAGEDETPVWTPDGGKVTYSADRTGHPRAVYWKPSDGSGAEERLLESETHPHVSSWSPDGRTLVYTEFDPVSSGDIWVLTLGDKVERRPWLRTPFNERAARLSPDGHRLAYVSNESGRTRCTCSPSPGREASGRSRSPGEPSRSGLTPEARSSIAAATR